MNTGIVPSAVGQLLRDRSVRLAAGLAVAVAIPVAVLFFFQFRALRDLGESSAVVLRQLSQETVDEIAKSIDDALKAPHINVQLRITQAQTEPLDLAFIQRTFEDSIKRDTFITRYYVWSTIGLEHRGDVLAYDPQTHAFVVNPPEGAALLEQVRGFASRKRAIVAFPTSVDGRHANVQVQLRFNPPVTRDRLTSFVAFSVDARRLRHEYFPALLTAKMRSVQGPTGFPPLVVTVADDNEHVIFPAGA